MMTKSITSKKNLLLCFDAFDTLFTPRVPIATGYARAAVQHGIKCGDPEKAHEVGVRFREAFKDESKQNPNYGKATGLGAEKWWGNVIQKTFTPFLKPNEGVPQALITDLLVRYSSQEGYKLFPDVLPFFQTLRHSRSADNPNKILGSYEKTVVGIITNSDARASSILESFGLNIGPRRIGTSEHRIKEATLKDDVSFVVLSYDAGFEKPDKKIFDAGISMLEETLTGTEENLTVDDFDKLYVGDELEKDYEGAKAAGWHAVLLDRNNSVKKGLTSGLKLTEVKNKKGEKKWVQTAGSLADLETWQPSNDEVD